MSIADTAKAASIKSETFETVTASAKVFSIPELVEQILLNIHFGGNRGKPKNRTRALTLFTLQRVNLAFKETLDRNLQLQQRVGVRLSDDMAQRGTLSPLSTYLLLSSPDLTIKTHQIQVRHV